MSPKDRAHQIEQRSPLRLPNKISDASMSLASQIRSNIKEDTEQYRTGHCLPRFFLQMATMTSLLPPHWESYPVELKMFLEKEMFDPVIKHVLESEHLLNWCTTVKQVHPLNTPGDGNCLLHAVSLGLWAMEDDELILRSALYRLLLEDGNEQNRIRWQRERMKFDAGIPGSDFMYNSTEWHTEWALIKTIANHEQRPQDGLQYESLEQFHIFMLANMLRRPIIVIAQDMMRSHLGQSLQPQNLSGIYLPLNWDPSVCYRYPILLGFHQNHFTPLLCTAQLDSGEDEPDYVFPIVHQDLTQMPVRFLLEDEEKTVDMLLEQYLLIVEITHLGKSLGMEHRIMGARLACNNNSPEFDLMIPYLVLAETHYRYYLEVEFGDASQQALASQVTIGKNEAALSEENHRSALLKSGPSNRHQVRPHIQDYKSGSGAPLSQPSEYEMASKHALHEENRFSLINQTCKTEGCNYYRSVSTGEYCHECFQKQEQKRTCVGDRCLNSSEQGCQGLCRVCFDQRQFTEIPAASSKASPPSLSKMSIDPLGNMAVSAGQKPPGMPLNVGNTANMSQPGDFNIMATKPLWMINEEKAASSRHTVSAIESEAPSDTKEIATKGHGHSQKDEINSLIVHQKFATKKCIMPECLLTGHPETNDMCKSCYAKNLEVAQEVMKSKQIGQLAPAMAESGNVQNQSPASHAATSTAGSGMRGLSQPIASASASELTFPKEKPRFTVKKNICASAGCDGVRLVDQRYLGFCHTCHNKTKTTKPQSSSALSGPSYQRASQVCPDQLRAASPTTELLAQPVHSTKSHTVRSATASTQHQQKEQKTFLSSTPPVPKQCAHPRCDNPAAPPKYLLCDQCIAVSLMYQEHEKETEVGSTSQEGKGNTHAQQPAPKEAAKHVAPPAKSVTGTVKPKALYRFKNVHTMRVKCQMPNGCPDNMFGDPDLNDLCSRCFQKTTMRRTRHSPPTCRAADTRPSQSPSNYYVNNQAMTAPLNPSPRMTSSPPPKAQTEFMYKYNTRANYDRQPPQGSSPKRSTSYPANYQKCGRPGCRNQANIQILEGYCNTCYPVYRGDLPAAADVDPAANLRGQFAPPSQLTTAPEGWMNEPLVQGPNVRVDKISLGAPPIAEPHHTNMVCLSVDCPSYGNTQCQGYCNSCFKMLLKN